MSGRSGSERVSSSASIGFELLGALRANAVRRLDPGLLGEVLLNRQPVVLHLDLAAPRADVEEGLEIAQARDDEVDFVGRENPQQDDHTGFGRNLQIGLGVFVRHTEVLPEPEELIRPEHHHDGHEPERVPEKRFVPMNFLFRRGRCLLVEATCRCVQ